MLSAKEQRALYEGVERLAALVEALDGVAPGAQMSLREALAVAGRCHRALAETRARLAERDGEYLG